MYSLADITKVFSDEETIRLKFLELFSGTGDGVIHWDIGQKGLFTAKIERATPIERLTHFTYRHIPSDFIKRVILQDIENVGITRYASDLMLDAVFEPVGNFKITLKLTSMITKYDEKSAAVNQTDSYDERDIIYHWLTTKYKIPVVIEGFVPSFGNSVEIINEETYNRFYKISKKEENNEQSASPVVGVGAAAIA